MPLYLIPSGRHVIDAFFRANAVGFKYPQAIRFKHGVLSPGAYINNRALPSHPPEWGRIITAMREQASRWAREYNAIASVAVGGVSLGAILSYRANKPHFIVRTHEKGHGLEGFIDGDTQVLEGRQVLLIDDMSSTFESSPKAMKILERHGANVVHTLLLNTWNLPDFKRNVEPYSVAALCTGEMFLDYAWHEGDLSPAYANTVRHWLEHPEDENWARDGAWNLPKE